MARWFENNFQARPFFTGRGGQFVSPPRKKGNPVPVILMGNFLSQLLQVRRWPPHQYQLWCLGSAVRDVCVNLLQIPRKNIGVIPRYALFPLQKTARALPSLESLQKEPLDLVYGGRLSFSKNTGLLLRVASLLQTTYHLKVRMNFLGSFDHWGREDYGLTTFPHYKREIHRLIQGLPWREKPVFPGTFPPEDWPHRKFHRPVFFNLSTFYMDDFGVALAQAQQWGWPCVLSQWGGHRDAAGTNVIKMPFSRLEEPTDDENTKQEKAKILARFLLQKWKERSASGKKREDISPGASPPPPPLPLDQSSLVFSHLGLLQEYSPDILKMTRVLDDPVVEFCRSDSGKKFLTHYRQWFSRRTRPGPLPQVLS